MFVRRLLRTSKGKRLAYLRILLIFLNLCTQTPSRTSVRQRPLSATTFLIHYALTTLPLEAIQTELWTASLNKVQINIGYDVNLQS